MSAKPKLKVVTDTEQEELTPPDFKDGDGDAGNPLDIGEIVMLNSGSPAMTVVSLPDDESIIAMWFDGATPIMLPFPIDAIFIPEEPDDDD